MTAAAWILWVDVETTGLDPAADGAALLEVACVLTDPSLRQLATFEEVIQHAHQPPMDDFVRAMHQRSGLLALLPFGNRLSLVESLLVEWRRWLTKAHGVEWPRTMLGGSSVHFDRRWLEAHLPVAVSGLSHRHVDTTTLRQCFDWWAPESRLFDEAVRSLGVPDLETEHRAMADVEYSIAIARAARARLGGAA